MKCQYCGTDFPGQTGFCGKCGRPLIAGGNNSHSMMVTQSLSLSAEAEGAMVCIRGEAIGQMVALPNDKLVVVGRDRNASVHVIHDAKVSRRHLEITYVGSLNKYRLRDCSKNGTFLQDGTRLEKNRDYYLSPGAEFRIGNEQNVYKLR